MKQILNNYKGCYIIDGMIVIGKNVIADLEIKNGRYNVLFGNGEIELQPTDKKALGFRLSWYGASLKLSIPFEDLPNLFQERGKKIPLKIENNNNILTFKL